MFVYYNSKGVGNVLLIPLKSATKKTFEKHQDIVKIIDEESNELVGYNIFQASKYFNNLSDGKWKLDESRRNELEQAFQQNGLENEKQLDLSPKFVVGHVTEVNAHENADKLKVCKVDVGEEVLQIVCGAPNVAEDQKVVVAKIGAIMPSGLEIKPSKLRGVESYGMLCSQKELGLPNAPQEKGIYVLENTFKAGEEFLFDEA